MRIAVAMLAIAFTTAKSEAFWGPWSWGPPAYYYQPRYYVPVYYPPVYYYPVWACECPLPVVPQQPPVRMPETPPVKSSGVTPERVPYSPIVPAGLSTEEKIPKVDVPLPKKEEPPKLDFKPSDPPKVEAPKIELPPLSAPVPKLDLPPLAIPSTSKYGPRLDVKATATPGDARHGKYQIGFFNYTDREVEVMVDGAKIALPSRHSTTATVKKNYRWSLNGNDVEFAAIPDGAAGAEVSIR